MGAALACPYTKNNFSAKPAGQSSPNSLEFMIMPPHTSCVNGIKIQHKLWLPQDIFHFSLWEQHWRALMQKNIFLSSQQPNPSQTYWSYRARAHASRVSMASPSHKYFGLQKTFPFFSYGSSTGVPILINFTK